MCQGNLFSIGKRDIDLRCWYFCFCDVSVRHEKMAGGSRIEDCPILNVVFEDGGESAADVKQQSSIRKRKRAVDDVDILPMPESNDPLASKLNSSFLFPP